MRKGLKLASALLLSLALLLTLLPGSVSAAGLVEVDRAASLQIRCLDGELQIPNAHFEIHRVAELNTMAYFSLTEAFVPYLDTIDGLRDLNGLDQPRWATLAQTLKAYIHRDGIAPLRSGETDEEGMLVFSELPVGLYLVLGTQTTVGEDTYSFTPFLICLPNAEPVENEWHYDVTVQPKHTKEHNPPDDPDDHFVTRKVQKKWDDEGFGTLRPEEITVMLLCDGEVYDTQTLTADNSWRYAWDQLPADHEWEIAEQEITNYTVTIEQDGMIFLLTNRFTVPPVPDEPTVLKRVTGAVPYSAGTFAFRLQAADPAFPMPEGSENGVKEITLRGAGSVSFGKISFTLPGTYVYTITEVDRGEKGYTYDKTVYRLTYHVELREGKLNVSSVLKADEETASQIVFTNDYTPPDVPYTGMLWWPVPLMLCMGLLCVSVGLLRRKRSGNEA